MCWKTVQVPNTMDSLFIMVTYDTIVHTAQQLQWKKYSVRFALINDTPYLTLMGELWDAFLQVMTMIYQEHTVNAGSALEELSL